ALLTFALMPEVRHYRTTDLKQHYFEQKNWSFGTVIGFLCLSRASHPRLPDYPDTGYQRARGTVIVALSVVWLLFSSNYRIHIFLMVANLIYLLTVSFLLPVRGLTAF